MLNVLVLYQCHFKTCCYNVTLTSYQWLYQHWTLNILLRCCKSTHTKRGQVCDELRGDETSNEGCNSRPTEHDFIDNSIVSMLIYMVH
jgi:hypothetical protein